MIATPCYSLITSCLGSLKVHGHLEVFHLLVCRFSVMECLIDRMFPHGLDTFENVKPTFTTGLKPLTQTFYTG
jgi:hypothetical protein